MNVRTETERIIELLGRGKKVEATAAAQKLEDALTISEAGSNEAVKLYAQRLEVGEGHLALFARALVERGAEPSPLADALVKRLSTFDFSAAEPPAELVPLLSAAASVWAGSPTARQWALGNPAFRAAAVRWAPFIIGGQKLALLSSVDDTSPLVVWVPELRQAFRVKAQGLLTAAQLYAVLADTLAPTLAEVGAKPTRAQAQLVCDFQLSQGLHGEGLFAPDDPLWLLRRRGSERLVVLHGPRSEVAEACAPNAVPVRPEVLGCLATAAPAEPLEGETVRDEAWVVPPLPPGVMPDGHGFPVTVREKGGLGVPLWVPWTLVLVAAAVAIRFCAG